MRALQHAAFGDPAAVLKSVEIAKPEPGPGQARVRLVLSPMHNHDYFTIQGTYGYKPPLPATGGSEAMGVIDALGQGVAHLKVGQRVAAGGVNGVWAEFFIAPASNLIPVPDDLSDEAAAQLFSMPMSAAMLLGELEAPAGGWLVQNAATGAVAKVLAPLAESKGVNVVNIVRRAESVAELQALGLTNVLATSDSDWESKALALTGDKGFDRAVDSVGGAESGQLLRLLKTGGKLATFGAMSGKPMLLDPGVFIFKEATITGFWGAKSAGRLTAEQRGAMLGDIVALLRSGKVKLPLEGAFAFDDVPAAMAAHVRAGRLGKVAFKP